MKNKNKYQLKTLVVNLFKRSKIINKIRKFFYDKNILEIETPVFSHSTVTDVNISSFKTYFNHPFSKKKKIIFNH